MARPTPVGPAASIDLPPELLCQRAACGETCGGSTSWSTRHCDPAGAVFLATLKDNSELDRSVLLMAGSDNVVAVRWLLLLGASLTARDCNGTSLLHAACRSGSYQMVREFVERGVPLDAADDSGWTPLHVAACMGRQAAARCLLEAGGSALRRTYRGLAPEELCSHPGTKQVIARFARTPRHTGPSFQNGGSQHQQLHPQPPLPLHPQWSGSELRSPLEGSLVHLHALDRSAAASVAAAIAASGRKERVFEEGPSQNPALLNNLGNQQESRSFSLSGKGDSSATTGWLDGLPNQSMRFEPCFVPREAALPEHPNKGREVPEELRALAIEIFNRSPGHAVAFLVAAGIVRDYPVEINQFLTKRQASPAKFGEYLGEPFPMAQNLRLEILNSISFLGTSLVAALEQSFQDFEPPRDVLRCNRLLADVAHFWWIQHEEEEQTRVGDDFSQGSTSRCTGCFQELAGFDLYRLLRGHSTLHGLMFSTVMLHRWLERGETMTLNEWVAINANIELGGGDVSVKLLSGVFQAVVDGLKFAAPSTSSNINNNNNNNNGEERRPNVKGSNTSPILPTLEGNVWVLYNGRAQASHNGVPSEFPDMRPRLLAAMGGVTSTGMSSCATMDLSRMNFEDGFDTDDFSAEEFAWVSLHRWYLFFSPGPGEKRIPYAFMSLKRIELRVIDTQQRRLILTSVAPKAKPADVAGGGGAAAISDEWLDMCLLLADGRFQQLEAPRLQLRFPDIATFDLWVALLSEAAADRMPTMARTKDGGMFPSGTETLALKRNEKELSAPLHTSL